MGALATLTGIVESFHVAEGVRDWRRATKFDHVAFADLSVTDGPELSTAEPTFACYRRSTTTSRAQLVLWDLRKPAPGGEPIADLRAYLTRRAALVGLGRVEPLAASPEMRAAFQPTIDTAPPALTDAVVVHHARFGEGRVLERVAPDKLRIDFGAHGVRVLAAAYVTAK